MSEDNSNAACVHHVMGQGQRSQLGLSLSSVKNVWAGWQLDVNDVFSEAQAGHHDQWFKCQRISCLFP